MPNHQIEIKHFTCVINLQKKVTAIYLKFEERVNRIIKLDKSKTISLELVDNRYLVIYVNPSAVENIIMDKLKKAIFKLKLDYVIIDELFPMDNTLFLKEKGHPAEALWIKNKTFSAKQSFIAVE